MHNVSSIRATVLGAVMLTAALGGCARDRHPEQQTAAAVDTVAQVVPTPSSAGELPPSTPGYRFADARGNQPLSLQVLRGRRVSAVILDSAAMALPIPDARERAQLVARELWTAIADTVKADTVSVAFTDQTGKERATREFYFYAADLGTK